MSELLLEDGKYTTEIPPKKTSPASRASTPLEVLAPIPGVVAGIAKKVGDPVEPGEPLVYLEAMKMENEISAKIRGVVGNVLVKTGARVKKNDILVTLKNEKTT